MCKPYAVRFRKFEIYFIYIFCRRFELRAVLAFAHCGFGVALRLPPSGTGSSGGPEVAHRDPGRSSDVNSAPLRRPESDQRSSAIAPYWPWILCAYPHSPAQNVRGRHVSLGIVGGRQFTPREVVDQAPVNLIGRRMRTCHSQHVALSTTGFAFCEGHQQRAIRHLGTLRNDRR